MPVDAKDTAKKAGLTALGAADLAREKAQEAAGETAKRVRQAAEGIPKRASSGREHVAQTTKDLSRRGQKVVRSVRTKAGEPAKGARTQAKTALTEAKKAAKQAKTAGKRGTTAAKKAGTAVQAGAGQVGRSRQARSGKGSTSS